MARGITVDLIVDPKGAIKGLATTAEESEKTTSKFSSLGKIGVKALAAIGTAAAAAGTGLVLATVSAAKYADEILEASTKTNIAADTLQVYKYAAEQIDVSFETFTKSQGKFVQAMNKAADGTGPAAEAFDVLGISATDASGNLLDSETAYWQAIDALGGVANETERTALAQQIFGKSGAELNSIIAQGSEGFEELRAQAEAAGAVMSGAQLEALGQFDDKMQALTSTVDAAKNALGLTLLPVLDELAGSGQSALGEFTSALLDADGDLTKAGPAFAALGENIAGALTTAVPKVLEVGTSIVTGLVEGIVSQGPSLIETAIPLLLTFVTGILGMLPAILDAGIKILIALVEGIAAALPTLIPAAVEAVVGLVGALIQNAPLLLQAGLQLIVGLVTGILDALPVLIGALPGLILGMVDYFVGAIPMIIQTGVTLLTALVEALPVVIDAIVNALPVIITGIVTALISAVPQLIAAGIQLFVALIGALPQIIMSLIGAVPKIITGLVKAFTSPKVLKQLGDAGRDLIEGLWKGIQGAGDWLWKQLSGFFGNQLDMIKDFLGIASPSTVFAGYGLNIVQGLAGGISRNASMLDPVMAGLSSRVTSGFQSSLSANASGAVAAGVGVGGGGATVQISLPVTNSFVGDRDEFARYATTAIRDGLRRGSVQPDWSVA